MEVVMRVSFLAVGAILLACGGGYSSDDGGDPAPQEQGSTFTIVISGMTFSPAQLQVTPGATVTVQNLDSMPHSVTSQAMENAFTPGEVAGVAFDTGAFTGTRTIAIPTDAAIGTVIPYYCTTHLGTMVTPNGSIVVAAAPSNPDPGSPPPPTSSPY
jgi:plastocyanin